MGNRTQFSKAKRARRPRQDGYLARAKEAFAEAQKRQFGSSGPASPVRRIDPKTGAVIATIENQKKDEGG